MTTRLKHGLSVLLATLALLPFTAPFATFDLGQHSLDGRAPQVEVPSAKTSVVEDSVMVAAAPVALQGASVFVMIMPVVDTDEKSKHQIPSRILRL